jgi:hypothetical protein
LIKNGSLAVCGRIGGEQNVNHRHQQLLVTNWWY